MIKIKYQPWKELVLHEIIEYEADELFKFFVTGAKASQAGVIPSLGWAGGVVFSHSPLPDTEEVVQEKLNGTIHYSSVIFAVYPEYRPEINVDMSGNRFPIRLTKIVNPVLLELAKYLREGSYKKTQSE
jgi:hypothetical protein